MSNQQSSPQLNDKDRGCLVSLGIIAVCGLLIAAMVVVPIFFPRCEGPYALNLAPEGLDPNEFDTSLLTGQPCDPPCWQGAVPGLTTDEELASTLVNLSFVEPESIDQIPRPALTSGEERSTLYWDYGRGKATILDGVVTTLSVEPYYDVVLGHLIERFGEPDGYFVYTYPPPDAIRIGPGCVSADVQYVWPDQGLMAVTSFYTRDPPRRGGVLFSASDTLYVHDVIYSPPAEDVWSFLVARGREASSAQQDVDWFYQSWMGEGEITLPVYYQE